VAEGAPPEAPEDLLLDQESHRIFIRAMEALPFHERTAMVLLVQHGCSYQDVATVLDTPVSTVRTRVSRACHRLRRLVTTLDATPSPQHPSRLSAGHIRRRGHRPLPQVR
jgi:DNA-directed RNA polymerase specialized sigma24 family protein